jgi:hypothetical protein
MGRDQQCGAATRDEREEERPLVCLVRHPDDLVGGLYPLSVRQRVARLVDAYLRKIRLASCVTVLGHDGASDEKIVKMVRAWSCHGARRLAKANDTKLLKPFLLESGTDVIQVMSDGTGRIDSGDGCVEDCSQV